MHHCSSCDCCCLKYDHHCGMVMNCIGVNNYHLFLQFIPVTALSFLISIYCNLKYNFVLESTFYASTSLFCFLFLLFQVGCVYYAFSMAKDYFGLALKNMHAVEQSIAGNTYNKASFWGLLGPKRDKTQGDKAPLPDPKSCCVEDRVYFYTKQSKLDNLMSMLQSREFLTPLVPLPYNFMSKIGTFKTGESDSNACLWMVRNQHSFLELARLEW